VDRLITGVPGLDEVLGGGIPKGGIFLIGGQPGVGKTVLTQQLMYHHARLGGRGLFLTTLSEPVDKVLEHNQGFAWFDRALVGGAVAYLSIYDAVQQDGIANAVDVVVREMRRQEATLLIVDGFRAVHDLVDSEVDVRRFIFELGGRLRMLDATTLLVGEYSPTDSARFPEFTIVDGIVLLDLGLGQVRERRTLQVTKLRGSAYLGGRHAFEITGEGTRVYPRQTAVARVTPYRLTNRRISTGVADFDQMLGGGMLENSATLVVGTPGTGKTLLGLRFLDEGRRLGEPGAMVTCDESPEHLELKASHFGLGGGRFFDEKVHCIYAPAVEMDVDALAARIREAIAAHGLRRIVIDGAANLESALDPSRLNDYVVSLINYFRGHDITSIYVRDQHQLSGGPLNIGGLTFSATACNVMLLHHVDLGGRLGFVVSVVKTRDSAFDPVVRHFRIDLDGIHVGEPLLPSQGTLMGPVTPGGERETGEPTSPGGASDGAT
jgi:circadian clock protein KaiC